MVKKGLDPSLGVFLCYATEMRSVAEEIYHALITVGHKVFFDRHSIPSSAEYHSAISAAIELSDVAVYLVSPRSVEDGAYTRSELQLISKKWPSAEDRLVTVLPRESPVALTQMPAYARSVSVLKPEGDLVAEVVQEVRRIAIKLRPKYRLDADEMNAIETAFARLDKEWEKDQVPDTAGELYGIGCVSILLVVVVLIAFGMTVEATSRWALLIPMGISVTGLIVIAKMIDSLRRARMQRSKYLLRRAALRKQYEDWLHENIGV